MTTYSFDTPASDTLFKGSVTNPSVATSNALKEGVYLILVSAATHIAFGSNPTAANTDFELQANVPLEVYLSEGTKISALPVSGAGRISAIRVKKVGV